MGNTKCFCRIGKTGLTSLFIADPEKCFQELISEKLVIFFAGWALFGINSRSSNFQALLLLQDKLPESV